MAKQHISENFRLITPILTIYITISISMLSFFFVRFYEEQRVQGENISLIREKIKWMEGHFGFQFSNLTIKNPEIFN